MTDKLMLAIALSNTKAGTQLAAALVDPDRTARIELIERTDEGYKNITLNARMSIADVAEKFDDMVVTSIPGGAE